MVRDLLNFTKFLSYFQTLKNIGLLFTACLFAIIAASIRVQTTLFFLTFLILYLNLIHYYCIVLQGDRKIPWTYCFFFFFNLLGQEPLNYLLIFFFNYKVQKNFRTKCKKIFWFL